MDTKNFATNPYVFASLRQLEIGKVSETWKGKQPLPKKTEDSIDISKIFLTKVGKKIFTLLMHIYKGSGLCRYDFFFQYFSTAP